MFRHLAAFATTLLFSTTLSMGQEITIKPDHDNGIYAAGETVRWTIDVKSDLAGPINARYLVRHGGLKVLREGDVKIPAGQTVIEATTTDPGWLLLTVDYPGVEGKSVRKSGGALFSPEQIKPALPAPDDFDAFWSNKVQQLSKIPIDPVVEEAPSGLDGVKYFLVSLNNINDTHVRGQLAVPDKEGKFPAMIIFQNAGVYPLKPGWIAPRASAGWITLNIQAHDLPVSETPEFYKQQSAGPLKDYSAIGNTDRETCYFLRMYLGCHRAAEYLTTRPDWDGKNLVVVGASQGGMQAIVAAALHPRVSAAFACVPAGCDNNSNEVNRTAGWPYWPSRAKGENADKIKQTGRYFDVINFAPKVKCPILITMGGVDTGCPPHGIYAAANQITSPKKITVIPQYDHVAPYETFWKEFGDGLSALITGKPLPLE